MHSRLLVSGLPRSLSPLPPLPAPPCLPCIEGRQRAALHSSSFPPTTAPLQTLHMDVWGPARVSGQSRERYFLLLWERFCKELPVLRLLSHRGGEFSFDLLRDFCHGEGILQSFTLQDSPHQNGIAERRIGLVMEVARTSMIHAAAPHFMWPFAVWYTAHQLNLWPRFYHPTSRHVFPSHDVTFDESVPFYPVDSGAAQGAEPRVAEPAGVESGGAEPEGVEPGGADSGGAEPRGPASSGGGAGASPRLSPRPLSLSLQQLHRWFTQRTRLWSGAAGAGDSAAADIGAGGAGVTARAGGTGDAASAGLGGARTMGIGAAGTGSVGGAVARNPTKPGAARAGGAGAGAGGVGGVGAGGAGAVGAAAGGTGAGSARPGGAGAVDSGTGSAGAGGAVSGGTGAGGTVRPFPYFSRFLVSHLLLALLLHYYSVVSLRLVLPPLFALVIAFLVRVLLLSPAHTLWHFVLHLFPCVFLFLLLLSPLFQSVGGECALGTDVLEDRQEDFERLGAAVLVYVDDPVFASADTEALILVNSELQKRHTCSDLGELRSYLGFQITRDRAQHTITLTQSHMVQQVLQRFRLQFSSPQPTPLSTTHSLSAPPSDKSVESSGPYPELVGCLMYLMTCTRPDLAYPLSLLACYVALGRHEKVHWHATKRVLRYLCSTSGMGLVLGGRGPVVLTGHADASWVDDSATLRSSQSYTFSLGSDSVSWRSTRSSSVLSSSCEAEIYAGAMADLPAN
ncbi:unnamed protein product [Closterium sp. NIES-53]